jgi:hypothetical protein
MQIALFSLNGFFDWNQASTSARTHTTCGLFVRACRAAARILEMKAWPTNTPAGTDPCITGPAGAAVVDTRSGREPRKGDIFHVATPGKNNDHVGIILEHATDGGGNWLWQTAEGGQGSCCLTRYFSSRKLVLAADGSRYHGEGAYRRPLRKWIDLDVLAKSVIRSVLNPELSKCVHSPYCRQSNMLH